MMRTGAIGEWAAPLASGAVWREAQRLVGQAGWRNENAVQNLAALKQVVEEYEAVNREFDITKLRWVVHHVPEVNADLLTRLKALGCGVEMGAFRWVTSSDPKVVAGPPFRTIVDHGIQVGIHGDGVHIAPLNPWLHIYYATTGINSFGDQVNPATSISRAPKRSACSRATTAGSCGWKTRSAPLSLANWPISRCWIAIILRCPMPRSRRSARC